MSLTRITQIKRLKRPLLVTFDAYGTLYRPRAPINLMYDAVGKEHGMRVQGPQQLNDSFVRILREMMKTYPNYGKNVLQSPDEWWTLVINKTFKDCAAPGSRVPKYLATDLINRFSGSAFYHYLKAVPATIKTLRNIEANSGLPIIIGVISNSDSRIASILRSFGFSVGDDQPVQSLRAISDHFALKSSVKEQEEQEVGPQQLPLINPLDRPDFDFVLASYDADCQKPGSEIFMLAERYAAEMMRQLPQPASQDLMYPWPYPFHRLHVGDDLEKDAVAAAKAGWKGVLFENRPYLRRLLTQEDALLRGSQTSRCNDLMRGVKQAIDEWCIHEKAEVEMSEDSKEAREKREKEARQREKEEPQDLFSDPNKLAATYEGAIAELKEAHLKLRPAEDSTPPASEEQSSGVEEKLSPLSTTSPLSSPSSPSSSSSSSSSSLSLSDQFTKVVLDKTHKWRAARVKQNLADSDTSFLRLTNPQSMRKRPKDAAAERRSSSADKAYELPVQQHQPGQLIMQPLEVRQERAARRQRGKLLKRLPQLRDVPINVAPEVVDEWMAQKDQRRKQILARKKEKLAKLTGVQSNWRRSFPTRGGQQLQGHGSESAASLQDGADGGGAARKQERQSISAASSTTPKKTDSSGS